MTSEEVSFALDRRPLLLPVGATEQHGPHLPLSVDVDIPVAVCRAVAARVGGLVAPAIAYGARSLPQSGGGMDFPGTIHVRGRTLIDYLMDVLRSYARAGTRRLVVLNGHYENESLIFEALDELRLDGGLERTEVIALSWWSIIEPGLLEELYGPVFVGWHAEHASLVETSLMEAISPGRVRDIRVDHETPPPAGIYFHPVVAGRWSTRGVLHRTSEASAATGSILFEAIVNKLVALLSDHFNTK